MAAVSHVTTHTEGAHLVYDAACRCNKEPSTYKGFHHYTRCTLLEHLPCVTSRTYVFLQLRTLVSLTNNTRRIRINRPNLKSTNFCVGYQLCIAKRVEQHLQRTQTVGHLSL